MQYDGKDVIGNRKNRTVAMMSLIAALFTTATLMVFSGMAALSEAAGETMPPSTQDYDLTPLIIGFVIIVIVAIIIGLLLTRKKNRD